VNTAVMLRENFMLRRGSVLVRCPRKSCGLFFYERFNDQGCVSGPCPRCGKRGVFAPADSELLAPGGMMTEDLK